MCRTVVLGFRLMSRATADVSVVQGLFIEVFLTAQLMIAFFLVRHGVFDQVSSCRKGGLHCFWSPARCGKGMIPHFRLSA